MFCKNCGKEIGTQHECSFCGYNPTLDSCKDDEKKARPTVKLPLTKITPLKTYNGMATKGLVMSILSFIPLPFMLLALIFNIKATLRCKPYRSGIVKCVIAWCFYLFWIGLYALVIYTNINSFSGAML